MLGGIAGQGGLPDISNKTQNIYNAYNTAGSLTTVVNITGSGYLLGISQSGYTATGARNIVLNLVVDGTTVFNGNLQSNSIYSSVVFLNLFKRFNTSLLIQHNASADGVNTAATIALD